MKLAEAFAGEMGYRRTPRGVRGLKHALGSKNARRDRSHPARGAWKETGYL